MGRFEDPPPDELPPDGSHAHFHCQSCLRSKRKEQVWGRERGREGEQARERERGREGECVEAGVPGMAVSPAGEHVHTRDPLWEWFREELP